MAVGAPLVAVLFSGLMARRVRAFVPGELLAPELVGTACPASLPSKSEPEFAASAEVSRKLAAFTSAPDVRRRFHDCEFTGTFVLSVLSVPIHMRSTSAPEVASVKPSLSVL